MNNSLHFSARYKHLEKFLTNIMKMQHIYQPVILATLLKNKGKASSQDVAKVLLQKDQSQIDYYTFIVDKSHPARVLKKHNLISKTKQMYELKGFDELNQCEIDKLVEICKEKISDYMEKRGSTVWDHRGRNRKPVLISVRYEVLKRAKGRCELCGISAQERMLDVDHIVPHNWGGKDDLTNYQALCYKCNTNKRATDSTDFRDVLSMYEYREKDCLFCDAYKKRTVLAEKTLAYVIADSFPVTKGHCLVIPKRHVDNYFELTVGEMNACNQLLIEMRDKLREKDKTIKGFNIGMNVGTVAGQTIFHCHTHLMPRHEGDVNKPRGGVRHTIPGQGYY